MSGFLFGGRNLDPETVKDVEKVFQKRTGQKTYVFQENNIVLISSRDFRDQEDIKVAFDGYILEKGRPEEIVADLYRNYGEDFAKHVDGAFRALIYDTNKNRFYGSADKAGRKVLYHTKTTGRFVCSSHLTPLLRHPEVKPELNKTGVADFLKGWSVSFAGGERLVNNVSQVYPSHCIINSQNNTKQHWFWDIRRDKRNVSDEEAASKLDELMTEGAEKLTDNAEEPFNVFLSGGFDSTFLVALLREVSDKQIDTYTWGWKDQHLKSGREMSDLYGTNHHEIKQDYSMLSDEQLFFYEEPHNAFARYPFHELYQKGVESYWTGLNSQATFPVCLNNIRKIDRIRHAKPIARRLPVSRLRDMTDSELGYKGVKALEILSSEYKSTGSVIDWGISRGDADRLLSEKLKDTRNLEQFIDSKWHLDDTSYQENYNYLQLRMRDTARYSFYAQDFDHYDVYGYLPALEYSYSLPMSQKKNRRMLQKIAKNRVPDHIITKGASGWDFVSEQFRQMIVSNEEDYRSSINDFIERGLVNEKQARKLLLPDKFRTNRGLTNQRIAVYLLERWIKMFVERDKPWQPPH